VYARVGERPAGRRGEGSRRIGLFALALLIACSSTRRASDPRDGGSLAQRVDAALSMVVAERAVETGTAPAPLARSAPGHTLQVQALSGEVRSEAPVEVGSRIAPEATLTLARGARLTLALDDHVRISLLGPLVARALPEGAPALLVREGSFSVEVSPRGKRVGTAFWLATPLARLDVADSARLFARVAARGGGELVLVSGHVSLAQPETALLLAGASARCVGPAGLTELSRPFATLEQAWEVFSRGPSCAPQNRGARGAPLDARVAPLAAALDAVEARAAREVSWLAEHSRLLALHDSKAQGIREQLAHSAALLSRERRWAAALRAQREAVLLGRPPTERENAELERARRLVPYDD